MERAYSASGTPDAPGRPSQAIAILNANLAARRADQAFAFEHVQGMVTAGRVTPSSRAKEVVRDAGAGIEDAVIPHQHPAGEAFIEFAAAIGKRRLAGLDQKDAGVLQ